MKDITVRMQVSGTPVDHLSASSPSDWWAWIWTHISPYLPPVWVWWIIGGACCVVVTWLLTRRLLRASGKAWTAGRAYLSSRSIEDVLTVVAASIATGVSAQGMWRFAEDVLGLDGPLRLLLFAFIEVAIITSAVRARRNMRENFSAGIDGIAVWALTCLTAVLSSMDARSLPEAVFRLAAPLVAAWLWERGMAIERHRIRGTGRINWRLTPERIFVRLGLAEASDRTAGEVDTQRRLTRVALAAKRAKVLRDVGAPQRKVRGALAKLDKVMDQALARTGLDASMQERVRDQVAALYSTDKLMDVPADSAWVQPVEEPFTRLADETQRMNEILAARHDSKESIANLAMLAAAATGNHLVPVTPGVTPDAITRRVTAPVTSEVTRNAIPAPRNGHPVTAPVPPVVTPSVTVDLVTPAVTLDVTNPDDYVLGRLLASDPYATPVVTFGVTGETVTGEVTEEPEDASKTQVMRDFWNQEIAEDRYPTPKELAEHAGVHPSLASRKRKEWVGELSYWQKRKADRKRDKASS